ncbi:MAG: GFA family protein [Aestuariivirga sp.]
MNKSRAYTGGCHCGAVKFAARIALGQVISCNCSICQKRGSLLTAIPAVDFRLLAGEDKLTKYQFNTRTIHHLFCSACGIEPFARAGDTVMVNMRCMDGVEPGELSIMQFDGRAV